MDLFPIRMLANVSGRVRADRIDFPPACACGLQRHARQFGGNSPAADALRYARVGDRHEIAREGVVENRTLTLEIDRESMGRGVVTNFGHDRAPVNAPHRHRRRANAPPPAYHRTSLPTIEQHLYAGAHRQAVARMLRQMTQQPNTAITLGESPVELAYRRVRACADDLERIAATAELILSIHDEFYRLLCEYPYRAKCAFETMDTHASIRISKERLELYSRYITEHGPRVHAAFPALAVDSTMWDAVDRLFVSMIVNRYEADIAFSFAHSMRRNVSNEDWRPVAYSFPPASKRRAFSMAAVHKRLPVRGRIDAELVTR